MNPFDLITGDEKKDLETILFLYGSALKKMNTKIEILEEEFRKIHQYDPIEHVTSRIKTEKSISAAIIELEKERLEAEHPEDKSFLQDENE